MSILDVAINPIGKCRMTQRDKWVKRDCVERYYSFKDTIRLEARKQKFELSNCFKIVFVIPMPKSWSNKKRTEMYLRHHQQKPDIDNLLKAVMDSLLADDSCVYHVDIRKWWGYEGKIIIENLQSQK